MADILRFFKSPGTVSGTSYDAEVVAMMGRAFELVRNNIALRGYAAVSDEAIAKQIIELTTEGQRDAMEITGKVIACFDAIKSDRRIAEDTSSPKQRSGHRYSVGRVVRMRQDCFAHRVAADALEAEIITLVPRRDG